MKLTALLVALQNLDDLCTVTTLQTPDLDDTMISNRDLMDIRRLPNVRTLFLQNTNVSEEGLRHLAATPVDLLGPMLSRVIEVTQRIEGNSPVRLVLEALFDDLASARSLPADSRQLFSRQLFRRTARPVRFSLPSFPSPNHF